MKNTLVLKTRFNLSIIIIHLCPGICQCGFIVLTCLNTIKPCPIILRRTDFISNFRFETDTQNQ